MGKRSLVAVATLLLVAPAAPAYVEAPYSLGQVCNESTNAVLVEIVKVNKEKNLLVYKKVEDLKGTHAGSEIKHNIGQRGYHPREWQNVMAWAAPGKRAVFFHNGQASETCIGTYWYQCYREGDWWGMSHAEPFLMRTYFGDADKLAAAVKAMQQGQEVVVACLADGPKEQLHLRKGKVQRLKASLKRLNYDAKRDFVAFGGDGDEIGEVRTFVLLAQSTAGWRFVPVAQAGNIGDRWRQPEFDDHAWRTGKAPIGYGEDEIPKRKGTIVKEEGIPFYFRRTIEVSSDILRQKDVTFRLCIASDDSADVFLNGTLVDHDPELDHEFAYWNRDVEVPIKLVKPGRNVIAVLVRNHLGSSDIYLDMEVSAQVPVPKPPRKPPVVVAAGPAGARPAAAPAATVPDNRPVSKLTIDRQKREVSLTCTIAPRKLPHLNEIYPIEVGATYPHPEGQKAHETVVNFWGIKPSAVHQALVELGLQPGKPAVGEGQRAVGPELKIYLELPGPDGKPRRLPLDQCLVLRKTGKPIAALRWHFTGSPLRQPDPEKDDKVYGADLSGTLIALFPVTDDTVIQSNLTMADEPHLKMETNGKELPKEGAAARLIIAVK
jgi:hypothetical protein